MAKSRSKEKEVHKCSCMRHSCIAVKGICMSVASLAMLAYAFGYIESIAASIIAGFAFGIYGLSMIIHSLEICPVCRK